ncbi:MAG: hypothetical protein PVF33_01530 [Candidatus Latescibacterota bacterium]|jgi:hypothetical protein
MLPSLLWVGIRRTRLFWIPIPVFLFWPFWLAGWVVWGLVWLFRIPSEKQLRIALVAGLYLSGVEVDIDTADGNHIHLRLV